MSEQKGPTYDQLYKEFNANELNSRRIFEVIYNELVQLKTANNNLTTQLAQLTQEKMQWQRAKPDNGKQEAPKIKKA